MKVIILCKGKYHSVFDVNGDLNSFKERFILNNSFKVSDVKYYSELTEGQKEIITEKESQEFSISYENGEVNAYTREKEKEHLFMLTEI